MTWDYCVKFVQNQQKEVNEVENVTLFSEKLWSRPENF